jgi:HTH-type transcriptional regulator/antitoxin HipB
MTCTRTPEDVGLFVRLQRKDKGWTQAELAKEANVGLRFLSELERGKPTCQLAPTLRVIHALALKINVRPERPSEALSSLRRQNVG